jgi:hypothetical protein
LSKSPRFFCSAATPFKLLIVTPLFHFFYAFQSPVCQLFTVF